MNGRSPAEPSITDIAGQPVIDYLTRDYAGFRQAMLDRIPTLVPEWTDLSESDLGVVLIELFAQVADILAYYQDRVANEAYLRTATQRRSVTEMLQLIGYQIDPGLSAVATLHLDVQGIDGPVDIGEGQLPIRVSNTGHDIDFEITARFALHPLNNRVLLVGTVNAGASDLLVAPGTHALAIGQLVYLEQIDEGQTTRSVPLTLRATEHVSAAADRFSFSPPVDRSFAATAVVRGNNVTATHGRTVTDDPRIISDGNPNQRVALSRGPVSHLLLAPDERPERSRRRSRPEISVAVNAQLWQEVETLYRSGPVDRHFTVTIDDRDRATIGFGDGRRGAIPPNASVIDIQYRVGLGAAGNVAPDTLTQVATNVAVNRTSLTLTATNPWRAQGGADHESTEEAKVSGPASVIAQDRAVTLADYERLALGFPGIGKARSRVGRRGGFKVIEVFVAPESPGYPVGQRPDPVADETKTSLAEYLRARMPLNRLSGVEVIDAVYVPIDISVDVHAKPGVVTAALEQSARQALAALFAFPSSELGRSVRLGDVYGAVYPIAGISYVVVQTLRRVDTPLDVGAPTPADVTLREHELAYADSITTPVFGTL